MANSYIPLPARLRKNGNDYAIVKRNEIVAIYAQWSQNTFSAYEVFKIKKIPDKYINGKLIKAHEKFPANEDGGYTLWTCKKLEKAKEKYLEITERAKKS